MPTSNCASPPCTTTNPAPAPRVVFLHGYLADRGVQRDLRRPTAALGDDGSMTQIAAELAAFTKPALLAWAADDKFSAMEDALRLAAILPRTQLAVIPASRTWATRDQPDRTADVIGELARRAATRPAA